jgi:hypothetical protein
MDIDAGGMGAGMATLEDEAAADAMGSLLAAAAAETPTGSAARGAAHGLSAAASGERDHAPGSGAAGSQAKSDQKGLREISRMVWHKVKDKGRTSYSEVRCCVRAG